MVIALMVGWKWIIRIPLIIFWSIAIPLSFTEYGFLTQLCQNHITTSLVLFTASLYFLVYPVLYPFFPKIKTNGGEIMERSTKILIIALLAVGALFGIALAAPGAMGEFLDSSVLAPVSGVAMGIVAFFDGFSGSQMIAAGLIGGLVLAVVINTVVKPKIQAKLSPKTTATTPYLGAPSYTPPTQVSSQPATIPQQTVVPNEEKTTT